jgi:hypothetical protein
MYLNIKISVYERGVRGGETKFFNPGFDLKKKGHGGPKV